MSARPATSSRARAEHSRTHIRTTRAGSALAPSRPRSSVGEKSLARSDRRVQVRRDLRTFALSQPRTVARGILDLRELVLGARRLALRIEIERAARLQLLERAAVRGVHH